MNSQTHTDRVMRDFLNRYNIKRVSQLTDNLVSLNTSSYYGKSPQSVKSFLSQVKSGKRRLSADLETSLLSCIKHLNPEVGINDQALLAEIRRAFSSQQDGYNVGKVKTTQPHLDYFSMLLDAQRSAQTILIVTAEPAETKATAEAGLLKDELLRHLQIIPGNDNTFLPTYKFVFPKLRNSYSLATQFWNGLITHGRFKWNIENIEDRLRERNSGKFPNIKVVVVEGEWGIDVGRVIIDKGLSTEIGFFYNYGNTVYSPEEKLNVMPMGSNALGWAIKFSDKILKKEESIHEYTVEELLSTRRAVF